MLEETVFDHETGRSSNATFGDLPDSAHAERGPDLDVSLRGHARHGAAIGITGYGEIAIGRASDRLPFATAWIPRHRRRIREPITLSSAVSQANGPRVHVAREIERR